MARHLSLLFVLALTLVIASVLFWQWRTYTGKTVAEKQPEIMADQQIIVKTQPDSLQITQIFKNLPNSTFYKVITPAAIPQWNCVNKNGKPCKTIGDNPTTFKPENGELRIQYVLPYGNNQGSLLLKNWTMALEKVNIASTKIEIVDSAYRSGTWVTAFPLKGHKELIYIDYSVFEGKGSDTSLYWQKEPLYLAGANRQIQFYSENPNEKLSPILPKPSVENITPMSIIKTNRTSPQLIDGLLITESSLTAEEIQKIWLKNNLNHRLKLTDQAKDWLTDAFLSLHLQQQAETPKGRFIVNELKTQMDQQQIEQLTAAVLQQKNIDAADLDAILSRLMRLTTTFFSSNTKQNQDLIPLVFFDKRPLHLNGKIATGMNSLLMNESLYFPFVQTMQMLGFQIQANAVERSIMLKKAGKEYLFYLNEHSFLLNGQKYGLLNDPFIEKEGSLYISQAGFQSIFKAKVTKTNSDIYITD
ncbi:stalk domain-containing protein [Bacillota bacterium Lsc_1132]